MPNAKASDAKQIWIELVDHGGGLMTHDGSAVRGRRAPRGEARGMELRYAVVLEPEADGTAFNVIVPALPKAHTWGSTVDEALAMAHEVIELCISERRDRGEEIPPSDAGTARLEAVTISIRVA